MTTPPHLLLRKRRLERACLNGDREGDQVGIGPICFLFPNPHVVIISFESVRQASIYLKSHSVFSLLLV